MSVDFGLIWTLSNTFEVLGCDLPQHLPHHQFSSVNSTEGQIDCPTANLGKNATPTSFIPPQDTTQPPPHAERPTERTACSGAWFSGKTRRDGQTALKRASSLGADPVRSRATPSRDFRKALCMGGVFAVSTVLPEKIQRLAYHLGTINRSGTGEVL